MNSATDFNPASGTSPSHGQNIPLSNDHEMETEEDDQYGEDTMVISACNSDGRDKIKRGNALIDNYPSGQDLVSTTKDGITSYFKEVDMNDDVSIDWRTNLAEGCKEWAIAKKLDVNWPPMKIMFENFPEYYRLYSQHQSGEKYGADERVDYFLYGHPKGLTGRYRTVDHFLPHCVWLMFDMTRDVNNCNCEICMPPRYLAEGLEILQQHQRQKLGGQGAGGDSRTGAFADAAAKKTKPKQRNGKKNKQMGETSPDGAPVAAPPRPHQQLNLPADAAASARKMAGSAVSQGSLTPTPLPTATDDQQMVDAQAGGFLYRPGEVVWYTEGDTGKMGLALITARMTSKGSHNEDRLSYSAQPLADPFHPQSPIEVAREDLLRPYLAYSAPPPYTMTLKMQLSSDPQLEFSRIDWHAVHRSDTTPGNTQIDGAVFAGKYVDKSYTALKIVMVKNEPPQELHHHGIFWGCEKIWLGEAVRLRQHGGQDIMVLQAIVQRIVGARGSRMDLLAIGDVYTLVEHTFDPTNPPTSNPHLPVRVLKDLEFRNRASIRHRCVVSEWQLTSKMAEMPFTEVRGRWYEARNLLPSIEGQQEFGMSLAAGRVGHVGYKLNNRWEAGYNSQKGLERIGMRTPHRLDAFAGSIPRHATLNDQTIHLQASSTVNEGPEGSFQQPHSTADTTLQEQYSNDPMTATASTLMLAEDDSVEGAFVDLT